MNTTEQAPESAVEDPARLAAVDRVGLVDTAPEERFDRITRLAEEMFDVPFALVNVVDAHSVFTKSQPNGMGLTRTAHGDSFCADTVAQGSLLEVPDAAADPRFASRAGVTELGIRYYAGIPLRTADGEAVATLCLHDTTPRDGLTAEQRSALEKLGRWAEAEIRATESEPHPGGVVGQRSRDETEIGRVTVTSLAIPFGEISGDRSGWQQVGEKVVVTLADVMGKGARAGAAAEELMASLQGAASAPLREALLRAEQVLEADLFATLFHAVIDVRAGRVQFVDAGHGLNLLLGADGSTVRMHSRNLPVGLRPDDAEWESEELSVAPGDLLVTVSDGALDAYDSTLDSLRQIGEELRAAPAPNDFLDGLAVRVTEHEIDDDISAVVVSIH